MKNTILAVAFLIYLQISCGQNPSTRFSSDSLLKIDVNINTFKSHSVGGGPYLKNEKGELIASQDRQYTILTITLTNLDTANKYITMTSWHFTTFDKKKGNYWERCRPDLGKYSTYSFFSKLPIDYEDYPITPNFNESHYRFLSPETHDIKKLSYKETFNVYLNIPNEIIDIIEYNYFQFIFGELTSKQFEFVSKDNFYQSNNIFINLTADERSYEKHKNKHKHLFESVSIINKDKNDEDAEQLEMIIVKQIKTPVFRLYKKNL